MDGVQAEEILAVTHGMALLARDLLLLKCLFTSSLICSMVFRFIDSDRLLSFSAFVEKYLDVDSVDL